MECKDYKDLIVSFAYHELSSDDGNELEAHLNTCSSCREEFEEHRLSYQLIHNLKASIPKNECKAAAMEAILTRIKGCGETRKEYVQPDRMIRILHSKIVRIIINSAAVFLVALFFYQQIQIKQSLKILQAKVEKPPIENQHLRLRYVPAEFTDLRESQPESIFRAYNESLRENQEILNYLEENYPEIYRKVVHLHKMNDQKTYEQ